MTQEIVFDIGGSNSRIALFNNGSIIWRDQLKTSGQLGPEAMVDTMLSMLKPLAHVTAPIGIAIAGLVRQGEVYANNADILKDWQYFPLEKGMQDRLQRPVLVRNDARAAAWGEYLYGSGTSSDNFLFITVSTGVGAGLILQRRLYLARNGFEAELGEAVTSDGSPLEVVASGSGLDRLARTHQFDHAIALCDAADAGDALAEELYRRGIRELAKKIADLVVMLGIEKVAVGGGVGLRAGYLERLREELAHLGNLYQRPIVAAELGHDAGLIGMAAILRNTRFDHEMT